MDKDMKNSRWKRPFDVVARVVGKGVPVQRTVVSRIDIGARFDPPPGQVSFQEAIVKRVDFSRTVWDDFRSAGSTFDECDFRGARFAHAVLGSVSLQSTFRDCRFDDSDLRHAQPGAARFEACCFDGARIEDWTSLLAEFVDSRFAGRIVDSIFSGRPWGPGSNAVRPARVVNEFRGNDFSAADLVDCSFVRGIDVAAQRWPEGENYLLLADAQARIRQTRAVITGWADEQARTAALRMLAVYSSGGYEEQDVLFVRPDSLGTVPRDVRDEVTKLLNSRQAQRD